MAELHFPESGSLKGKRMHLRSARDQVVHRFGASFAEIGHQDLWQRSRVMMCVAASDLGVLEATMDRMKEYLDAQDWVLCSYDTQVVDVDA